MTRDDPHMWIREDDDHRLLGQEVIHPPTGRTGTVGTVYARTSKLTGRTIGRTAHMRPHDHSGREWTADPSELLPLHAVAQNVTAGARR
ncbi:hypothetical protein ACIGFK_41545 [Streptomyces sp. NPDC085524]|uniref:hypothetical protein n=1 Tax=Streptomyces sp. NPDC085524 TaxID=3365728 RepID=UPI0037D546B7